MKIDVQIEAPRDLEKATNVPVWIRVGVGAAAEQVGALLARRDKKLLRAGIVEQAFLREYTDFEIDGPCVIALEPAHRVEAFQADARIDFDVRAHAHRALHDRFLQSAPPALINIILREGTLGGRNLRDRFLQRSVSQFAAIENA